MTEALDQSGEVRQAVAALKALIGKLSPGAVRVVQEKWSGEIAQDEYSNYPVLWEIHIDPANENACPIGVCISCDEDQELTYSLMFDSRAAVQARLGLRVTEREPRIIGFGIEPTETSLDFVLKILESVFRGYVSIRYIPLGGFLADMMGEVDTGEGIERFGGGALISYFLGERFQYEPWT